MRPSLELPPFLLVELDLPLASIVAVEHISVAPWLGQALPPCHKPVAISRARTFDLCHLTLVALGEAATFGQRLPQNASLRGRSQTAGLPRVLGFHSVSALGTGFA